METKKPAGRARWWLGLLAALALLTVATAGWAGQRAPDFTLKAVQDNKDYSLSQYRGKVVLLNFFTFFCGPCRQEMPHLSEMYQELKGQGFQVLGIGLASTPAQLKQIVSQLGLTYPVLEGNKEVSKAYGNVELVPLTFIIDRQGNIVQRILGARSKGDFEKMIKPLL
ncbi:MAG: TlpA disulfide reductase family protein [Deltaproteobacteria bacterium]|jgi:cytochrome c biogenesis protein CcmG, thiol:disulfide interchange protein DsbE